MAQNEQEQIVDIVIIGGGPAGMFAAYYAGLRQASVTIIESMPQLGGQLTALYPEKYIYDVAGFPQIRAQELVHNLQEQMNRFPVKICLEEMVLNVEKTAEQQFTITTNKSIHYAKSVIISAGVGAFEPRRLEVEHANQYEKINLHYFINDLSQFKDKRVLISGGGDSAVDWALMIEPIASQTMLVHRRDRFRAHESSVEQLRQSRVEIMTPQEITALDGENRIEQVTLTHSKTKETSQVDVDDVIINFGFISSLGPIAEWGFEIDKNAIVVDTRMETSVPGIFAIGDINTYPGKIKLIATGFGEAPTAVNNAKVYVDPNAKLSPGHSSNLKF